MYKLINSSLALLSCFLLVSCFGCSSDNRTVTSNGINKSTTLWEKNATYSFRINLSSTNGKYGYFEIYQERKTVMALDFISVISNNGTSVEFQAIPREELFTDWQRKKYDDQKNYNVSVLLDKDSKQYLVQFHDVPPGYEDVLANRVETFSMRLSQEKIDEYFNDVEFQQLRQTNGDGAALYLGSWVNDIYYHLFWIYAIVFGILSLFRGGFFYHLVLTAILYITFTWDFAPARAFIISYYVATPLLYIPPVKNNFIYFVIVTGAILAMVILGYRAWNYEGLFAWVFDMAVWGGSAFVCGFLMSMDLMGRCEDCGHFSLSWRGNTKRYELAENHFRRLSSEGYEIDETIPEEGKISLDKKRCAHCLNQS